MTSDQWMLAHELGRHAAEDVIGDLNERDPQWRALGIYDRDDIHDRAHPEAFAQALEQLDQCDAQPVSDAVHAGISDEYDEN